MMRCERLNLSLSTAGCARRFQKAQAGPPPGDTLAPCQFCPVGARHAGAKVAPMAKVQADLGKICPRCTRPTTRLINGKHCISCYNRHREALIGRNRRGTRPALADRLHTAQVLVVDGGQVALKAAPRVASRCEALMVIAKAAPAPVAFGLVPPRLVC